MKRVLLAGVLGGLAGFIWGAIAWMGLPFHQMTTSALTDDAPVMAALAETQQGPGYYEVPARPDKRGQSGAEADAAWMKAVEKGPAAYIVLMPNGVSMTDKKPFVVGLLIEIAIAAVLAGLMSLVVPTLPTYGRRVVFATVIGVACALTGPIMLWNWMHYPAALTLVFVGDNVMHYLCVGLVVAAIIKPRQA